MDDPVSILISYSHVDDEYRQQLGVALASLLDEDKITLWHDRRIGGGAEWDEAIKERLATAEVILLLLSADFIASDYIRKVEIPAAIDRHHRGNAVVIPVFLRKFDYSPNAPYAKLQGYPTNAVPVDAWPKRDEAYYTVVQGIRAVVERILEDRQKRAAKLQDARLRYRTKAKELLADGEIDHVERDTLDELRAELALSVADTEQIEREESEPHRKKDAAKEKYRKTLAKVVENDIPISAKTRESLDLRLRDLGLNPDDVERIEAEVFQQAESRRTERRDDGKPPSAPATDRAAVDDALAQAAADPTHPDLQIRTSDGRKWDIGLDEGIRQGLEKAIDTLVKTPAAKTDTARSIDPAEEPSSTPPPNGLTFSAPPEPWSAESAAWKSLSTRLSNALSNDVGRFIATGAVPSEMMLFASMGDSRAALMTLGVGTDAALYLIAWTGKDSLQLGAEQLRFLTETLEFVKDDDGEHVWGFGPVGEASHLQVADLIYKVMWIAFDLPKGDICVGWMLNSDGAAG